MQNAMRHWRQKGRQGSEASKNNHGTAHAVVINTSQGHGKKYKDCSGLYGLKRVASVYSRDKKVNDNTTNQVNFSLEQGTLE